MRSERMLFPINELEFMQSVYEVLLHAKKNYGDKPAYRQIESDGLESSMTFRDFADRVDFLRAGMIASDLKGKHYAIIGETSIEWINVYIAGISGVGVCVPLDKEQNVDSMAFQLNSADVDVVFVSLSSLEKVKKALPQCPGIKTLVIMRGGEDFESGIRVESAAGDEASSTDNKGTGEGSDSSKSPEGYEITTLNTLRNRGKNEIAARGKEALPEKIDPEEPCVIIFTSGTTGANKGVVLTNKNILGTLRGYGRLLRIPSTTFSVLPINHSYELHANFLYTIFWGTCVCINDNIRFIIKNLKRYQPEIACMVPMMLDSIVRQIRKEIKKAGKVKAFVRMQAVSNAMLRVGIDKRRFFFGDILESLGGRLQYIVCGGAMLDPDTAEFLTSIGVDILNGYGITECSPVVAVNSVKLIKFGSVGRVLPTDEVRIADPDENGNGEIQVRGDNVMKGYYKADEDTAQVFTEDGWFKTGDIGHLDADEYLYISGRIKNLIILPNGKNIYPEEIESNLMKKIHYIKECVVTENETGTGLYGYIYPDPSLTASLGIDDPKELKQVLKNDVDEFNRGEPEYKRIAGYEVRDREFEKNSTHKILRHKIRPQAADTEK